MLNTQKLLYILPDVAYVAELLPGKKEHTFTVQAFRQINGEFIDEEENFIPENIDKLFGKIEPETYHLVLPDFLFTNTILEVNDTNESKVKQQIKEELLPKLEITKDSHEIETFSLTTYNGVTKIQLTALEKSALDPIVVAANAHKVTIEHISPLTWTIKAVISLEPSISVLQIGSMLYVAQHYIGVDQCSFSKVDELENVAEAIKTLKGVQPSIQTVYLLTNQLVEEKLKDHLSNILPLQQLSSGKDGDDQMPPYVKQIIESGMKTLDIPDFPVPSFGLPKTPQGEVKLAKISDDDDIEEVEAPVLVPPVAPKAVTPPEAEPLEVNSETDSNPDTEEKSDAETDLDTENSSTLKPSTPVVPPAAGAAMTMPTPSIDESASTPDSSDSVKTADSTETLKPITTTAATHTDEPKTAVPETGSSIKDDDATVASLAGHAPAAEDITQSTPALSSATETPTSSTTPDARPVIKNKGEGGNLMKMAFVSLTVFALTVAIGIGIGYGWLSLNKQDDSSVTTSVPSPSPVASLPPVATQSATPAATASASIDKATFKILVVNATTTPGYAGTTSNKLKAEGFTQVTAGNAQGDYEPGFFILMAQNDPAIVSSLSEITGLDLTYQSGKTTEDPSNQYSAVIVLAK